METLLERLQNPDLQISSTQEKWRSRYENFNWVIHYRVNPVLETVSGMGTLRLLFAFSVLHNLSLGSNHQSQRFSVIFPRFSQD